MEYGPALLLVEFLAHGLCHALKLALGFGVVGLDHEGMEEPASPG